MIATGAIWPFDKYVYTIKAFTEKIIAYSLSIFIAGKNGNYMYCLAYTNISSGKTN